MSTVDKLLFWLGVLLLLFGLIVCILDGPPFMSLGSGFCSGVTMVFSFARPSWVRRITDVDNE